MRKRFAWIALIAGFGFFASWPSASALQDGAVSSSTLYTSAAQTKMSQPSARVHGTDGRAYWIGVTFPDGVFFQAGYLDASNQYTDLCQTGFSTFVTALDSVGNQMTSSLYNNQHCGITATRTFTLQIVGVSSSDVSWQWQVSGSPIGPVLHLPLSDTQFARGTVGINSEIVHVGAIGASEAFPTVHYSPAIQYKGTSGSFGGAASATFTRSSDYRCRYAMKVNADNDVTTGVNTVIGATTCYGFGASLW